MAELQERFGDGASGRAGEAKYADAAATRWGGDGNDGVFEIDHWFLMVTGRKIRDVK